MKTTKEIAANTEKIRKAKGYTEARKPKVISLIGAHEYPEMESNLRYLNILFGRHKVTDIKASNG